MACLSSRNCFNCLYFPYTKSFCDKCTDIKLSCWKLGPYDYKPSFMKFTRYIPDFYESEVFYEDF